MHLSELKTTVLTELKNCGFDHNRTTKNNMSSVKTKLFNGTPSSRERENSRILKEGFSSLRQLATEGDILEDVVFNPLQ